jgi:hypothetical protein
MHALQRVCDRNDVATQRPDATAAAVADAAQFEGLE